MWMLKSQKNAFPQNLGLTPKFGLDPKSDSCFNIPRGEFGGVGDVPGVVYCQAFLQIMRYACVVVHAGGDITKNVDVVEMRGRHKH